MARTSGAVLDRRMSTPEAARAVGLTLRQLDYMTREGVIDRPEHGSGYHRRWAPEELKLLRLLAVLRSLGATGDTLRAAARQAEELSPDGWTARVLVTAEGRIATLLGADEQGYLVDLAACRDVADLGILAAA